MNILGIEFAPLYVPLNRRLQTLAAAAWFIIMAFGGVIMSLFFLYLLLTRFWWFSVLYAGWIYLDRETCEKGGRPSKTAKNWAWWYYLKEYFPSHLTLSPDFHLDPERNYIFCCFPHGILPVGPYSNIQTHHGEFYRKFSQFRVHSVVLTQQFFMPVARELVLSMGCICPTPKSLNYVLSRPQGGQIVNLMVGGAAEAYNNHPGQYKFIVKNRKGFIKMALRNGSPLVPVITFGDTDLFEQIEGPVLRKLQEFVRRYVGFAPVLFSGRGFFQYSFGFIPRRKPVTTVVGNAIEVTKVDNPTEDQIEELHETFVQQLHHLFEEYKYKYLENPEDKHVELV